MPRKPSIRTLVERSRETLAADQEIAAALLERTGLTDKQCSTLFAVVENPGLTQIELSGIIGIDRSTFSDVVRRLERKCLVRKGVKKTDRRAFNVFPTELGTEKYQKMRKE